MTPNARRGGQELRSFLDKGTGIKYYVPGFVYRERFLKEVSGYEK